jgi:3-oxoacyl-[acyl-carrier-protein] synthase II
MREVVITGVGASSPVGNSLDEARAAYLAGKAVYTLDDAGTGTGSRARVSARVTEDVTAGLDRATARMTDRCTHFALRSAERALADAGWTEGGYDPVRVGTFLGCGSGSMESYFDAHGQMILKNSVPATAILRSLPNAPASYVAMTHGFRGECATFAVACSSAAMAIGAAYRAIRYGELDAAIAGGVETPLPETSVRAWEGMRVMARVDPANPGGACRPYSKDRTGIVLGEGGAMFMIEAAEHARARGARILATIRGYGTSSDASHITLPQKDGQVAAMRAAMADAGVRPGDIQYINAHGTATEAGDAIETKSVREAFGASADSVPMSATKSIHGHLLGASGAIEMLAVLVALRDGILAPTINLEVPDPECDLDYVANVARQGVDVRVVMTNSFAFGGSNASMILAK